MRALHGIAEKLQIVFPYDIQSIQELRVEKRVNDHARLFLTGLVSDEMKDRYIDMVNSTDPITVHEIDDSGEVSGILFDGVVSEISFCMARGVYYIEIEAISHSIRMDLKIRSRSFQHKDMTYDSLFNQVLSEYAGGDHIDNATGTARLEQFTVQYQETDWMFLKRLASRFGAVIVPEARANAPKVWIGLPEGKRWELANTSYSIRKSMVEGNIGNDYSDICYSVVTNRRFAIGDTVQFRERELAVTESITELKNGDVMTTYLLSPRLSVFQKELYNECLSGSALEGRVIDVQQDAIRVHLDIDRVQEKQEACWIQYASPYAAEGNSGFYCMPELGDTVQIYFPSNQEDEVIAIQSLQRGQGSPKKQTPGVKQWGTKYGKELRLGAADATLTAKDNSIFIKLDEEDGVRIQSEHGISLSSGTLELQAEQKLHINAQQGIYLQCKQSSMVLDGETDLSASALHLVGLVKSPVFVADLPPVPEPPLLSIEEYSAGSAGANTPSGKGELNSLLDGVQLALSVAGMIPVVGPLANAANNGISALRGDTQSAALSLTGSIPFLGKGGFNPYESGVNQITSDMLSKTNLYNIMSESLLMRGVNGDAAAMNEWKQRIAALPAIEEELTPFEKSKRARAEIKPTNEFVKFLKENIADPFADNIDYVRYETWGGRLVDRFGYSAASMIGPPVVDQPTTGNEIVDKIADFTGGAAGLVVNPGGVGTSTQNLFTTTNKMATSLAATKGGQIVQNTMSKSLEKVMNPNAAQRITQYTFNGAVTGSLHGTSISLIQNKSSGKELLEAALWGGAFGGAFGAIGGMLSPVLGKVFTAARQYTSKLKPNQIIANLKQSMKQKVVTGNPLAANPIRKGLETRGYKPKPGERTTTKEQYKAQEQKKREALRDKEAINNYQRLKEKVDVARGSLPSKYQKEDLTGFKLGNTGYAEVNIYKYYKGELKAFSKYGNLNKTGEVTSVPGWVSLKKLKDRRYYKDVLKVDSDNRIDLVKGYLRDKDTEYKIVEEISGYLKDDYNAKGVIHLYTERNVCLSCDNVMKSFSKDYKNITLFIYDSLGKIYKLRNGVVTIID